MKIHTNEVHFNAKRRLVDEFSKILDILNEENMDDSTQNFKSENSSTR